MNRLLKRPTLQGGAPKLRFGYTLLCYCTPADDEAVFGIDTLADTQEAISLQNALRRDVFDARLSRNLGDPWIAPRPGEYLAYGLCSKAPPLTRRCDAITDMNVSFMGNSDDGAKADDFAFIHDPPSRGREPLPNVVGKAAEHDQHFRRCDYNVGRKIEPFSCEAGKHRIEIIFRYFSDHFRLSDKPKGIQSRTGALTILCSRTRLPFRSPLRPAMSEAIRRQS